MTLLIQRPLNPRLDKVLKNPPELLQSAVIGKRVVVFRTFDQKATEYVFQMGILLLEENPVSSFPELFQQSLDDKLSFWVHNISQGQNVTGVFDFEPTIADPAVLTTVLWIETNKVFPFMPSVMFVKAVKMTTEVYEGTQ